MIAATTSSVTRLFSPPILLSLAAIVSTLLGGLSALRARAKLSVVLALTTGVVLGIVSFDLLPEVFALAHDHHVNVAAPTLALATAFLLFRFLEAMLLARANESVDAGALDEAERFDSRRHPRAGLLSAAALIGHSMFDGVSIGLAFQVSLGVGLSVAFAVIAHDLADGMNTVGIMVVHGNGRRRTIFMLALDAIAPIVGASSTLLFHVPEEVLVVFLGFFAGFLLHVATSASHAIDPRQTPRRVLQLFSVVVAGLAFAFVVTRFVP